MKDLIIVSDGSIEGTHVETPEGDRITGIKSIQINMTKDGIDALVRFDRPSIQFKVKAEDVKTDIPAEHREEFREAMNG